jgi:hypothetical protein
VPRAERTKPPGPLPAIEQIRRSKFRFRKDQWRELTKLLPSKLGQLTDLSEYCDAAAKMPHPPKRTLQTIADQVVHETEALIASYLTVLPLPSITPAQVRAAIRLLRKALVPFVRGYVDTETADIVPADQDAKLAARYQEIAKQRLPRASQRALAQLCQHIAELVRQVASANCETVSEQETLRFVDAALEFADIEHPDIAKRRARLAALVFPQD